MRRAVAATAFAATLLASATAAAGRSKQPQLRGVKVEEHLGWVVPKELVFTDAQGRRVELGSLFDGKHPVLLVLHYSRCRMLCHLVLEAVAAAVKKMDLVPGKDYRLAAVSFDPAETPAQSAQKQAGILRAAGYPGRTKLWPFLVGKEADIYALANALGFKYKYDPYSRQYAHPAVVFVLSPKGKISRYLYGINFDSAQLRLSLVDARRGKTGSFVDRVILTCFRNDPAMRKYALYVARFFKVGAIITLLAAAGMVVFIRRRGRRGRC